MGVDKKKKGREGTSEIMREGEKGGGTVNNFGRQKYALVIPNFLLLLLFYSQKCKFRKVYFVLFQFLN